MTCAESAGSLQTLLDMDWTLGNGFATDDWSPPIPSACISFALLSLASEIPVEGPTESFIRIYMTVDM